MIHGKLYNSFFLFYFSIYSWPVEATYLHDFQIQKAWTPSETKAYDLKIRYESFKISYAGFWWKTHTVPLI